MLPYFKGQPTDYIIRYSGGALRSEGMALAFFYWRFNTQIVAVPTQSQDVSFVFNELTKDFQEVTLQGQATYRIKDPKLASSLFNFSIDPYQYTHLTEDREKVGLRVSNLLQIETRTEVTQRTLQETLRDAPTLAAAMVQRLQQGRQLSGLGVELLGADFLSVRSTPEVAKALEAELREALLRKADEAIYARRAAAVDEERRIKEKELASDRALEEQRKGLIALQGANAIQEAENLAKANELTAQGDAKSAEMQLKVFRSLDPQMLLAYALKEMGTRAGKIGNLTITTEVLSGLLNAKRPSAK